jgi:cyanophycinase-like exopeptidase
LGTVGAEVIGAGTAVLVNVYEETYKREYTALYSTERFGTGMRLMVLTRMGYDPNATDQQNLLQNIQIENSHVNYP